MRRLAGDVDDAAAALEQAREGCPRRADRRQQVELERRAPGVVIDLEEPATGGDAADVVDEPVEPAVAIERRADELLGSLRRGQVDGDRGHARTVEPLRAARGADDVCPLAGEQLDGCAADPGGGAGDDDDPVGELEVHALRLAARELRPFAAAARPERSVTTTSGRSLHWRGGEDRLDDGLHRS